MRCGYIGGVPPQTIVHSHTDGGGEAHGAQPCRQNPIVIALDRSDQPDARVEACGDEDGT